MFNVSLYVQKFTSSSVWESLLCSVVIYDLTIFFSAVLLCVCGEELPTLSREKEDKEDLTSFIPQTTRGFLIFLKEGKHLNAVMSRVEWELAAVCAA